MKILPILDPAVWLFPGAVFVVQNTAIGPGLYSLHHSDLSAECMSSLQYDQPITVPDGVIHYKTEDLR